VQIDIKIDKSCKEPKVLIITEKMTPEIDELVKRLSDTKLNAIVGFKDDYAELLQQQDIIRLYTADQKVFAQTEQGEYRVKMRLYELEERLDKSLFLRISNSEMVNLKKISKLDLSFSGTICMELASNIHTYVSRRYVAKIKQVLGL